MREYTQWLDEQFLSDGCGSGLLVLPLWEVGKVMYRNEYRGFVLRFFSFRKVRVVKTDVLQPTGGGKLHWYGMVRRS